MIGCTTCCYDFAGCGGTHVSLPCAPSFVRPVVCAPRRLCAPSFVRPVVCAPRRLCAPSFVRPVVCAPRRLCALFLLMASLAISLLAVPHARAGTYVWKTTDANGNITAQSPVYSGGSTGGGPNGPNSSVSPAPFTSNSYYVGSAGYAGYSSGGCNADSQGHATSVTLTASGPLTATFTWQPAYPGEPPPASVIIYQDCQAALTNNRYAGICNASSVCTDGLGGSATLPFTGMQAATESYKYSVGTVGSDGTVSVSCSPSAAYNMSCYPAFGSYAAGAASISYTAAAYPVTVNLTGGIGLSTTKHLLIGQQLTATLSSGPLTQTSWSWGASGGEPFKNYTASDSSATYTPLGYETGSQLICYFSQPSSSASVSCTAHLAVPTGSSPASGLDVTATQSLTIEKPSAVLDVSCGSVTDLPTATNPTGVQLQQIYTYPQSGSAEGISWSGTITTPAAYVTSGNYGSWNWTQLITAQRQQKNNGVYWQFAVNTTTPATIINGMSVLDGNYPYGYFWYPSNGVAAGNADSPYQPLDASTAIREYDVSDSFNDYLMYLPPGSGSLPVPMKRSSWYWDFQALKDNSNNWSTSGMNAQWGFVGDFPAFPTWTFCATIGHLVYVAPPAQQ